jgi:multidrug resistance protein MdtO
MPVSPTANSIQELIGLLRPRPGQVEFATRSALICALTVLVAEIYQTPEPALTAYVVFFLNRADRTTSLIMSLILLVVFTLTLGIILLVAMAALDDSMWRFISIAILSFGFLFLGSASKLRPVGGIIALIVGYALDELGLIQIGEEGTRALLYSWLFVGIPAGVSILVNLLIAPPPRRLAERAIALRLELGAAMLCAPDEHVRGHFRESLREGDTEIQGWLKLAGIEKTSPPEDIEALRQAANSTIVILSAIEVMDRNPEASFPAGRRRSLARTLEEMVAILMSGGYPTKIAWEAPAADQTLSPVAAKLLADINDAIVRFTAPPTADAAAQDTPKEATGFFAKDAFTNPEHVHYALKTTAAAMFCYVLYSLLDWPGIHTCFITCYIVSLGTTAESVEKLALRILGCLIGAAAGIGSIVFLVPSLTSIGDLMTVVFLGAYPAAYVAGGSPRISYAGFQMAFAFFLCVVQGAAPAFDLTIARDRVVGILLGNVVVYLLFTNLWPVTVGKRIDPAVAALLRRLGAMMTAPNPSTRRALAWQARSALAAVETDIGLARYEPDSVRPPESWMVARREAAREIGALEGPLLLCAGQDTSLSADVASRLETLATRFAASEASPRPPNEGSHGDKSPHREWNIAPLFGIIDSGLRRLEKR